MSNILVTGATGQLGASIIESLLKKTNADHISVLIRDASKAEAFTAKGLKVVMGDYADYPAMVAALQGIDKLYLVSGTDIVHRTAQQANVIRAAKAAGVKHVLYTSFQRKKDTKNSAIEGISASHIETENALKASGLTYTLLQHGLYADIIPAFAGEQMLERKSIYLPAGDGRVSFALRADLAEAEATILLDETGKFDNKAIELTGAETTSWEEIAAMISEITGTEIRYIAPTAEEFISTLTGAGVPAEFAAFLSAFNQAIAAGEFEEVSTELEMLLGRKPLNVKVLLQSVYGK